MKKKGSDIIKKNRIIFHIDMNSYFVSCEVAENPSLLGKKVAVVSSQSYRHTMILAASYEAKAKGIYTTMKLPAALRLCPDLITVEVSGNLYSEYSKKFFDYLYSITPYVEPASIDEGYLDVTEVCEDIHPLELAHKMQKHLLEVLKLPSSIGIAPNKSLAKIASDMKKPMGITILRKREVGEKLWPKPIGTLLGVGKKSLPVFEMMRIQTVGDLVNYPRRDVLDRILGKHYADSLIAQAKGEGSNVIVFENFADANSVGHSHTFDVDALDPIFIKSTILQLVKGVSRRLRESQMRANTFTLQLKYNSFRTISRATTVERSTNSEEEIYRIIENLFDENFDDKLGVRLVGASASKLVKYQTEYQQLTIFDELESLEKENEINRILSQINQSQGKSVISRGVKINKNKKKVIGELK